MNEQELSGGCVNDVVRVGDTVRRSTGPWTPAVHALLKHLEAVGFRYSPRVLGIDEHGREILTYLPGTPAMRPWPAQLRTEVGLRAIGTMLRELADAMATFTPPADAVWRVGGAPPGPIRHGDLGLWNTVWDGPELVGLIDWDFAEPAPPLWDLAQAAWYAIPLRGGTKGWQVSGFAQRPDERARLRTLCAAYGAEPVDVLDALADVQHEEQRRVRALGTRGVYPFDTFLARGDLDELDAEAAWLRAHRAELLGGGGSEPTQV